MMPGPPASPAAAPRADIYLRNMALLWRFDPALAKRIDAIPDAARVPAEPAKSGQWTCVLPDEAGRSVYLHSRYDPLAEAQKLAATVEVAEQYCFAVAGFGLGYHLQALRRRALDEAIIVVAEPNLRLIATALACVDLTDVLAGGRLVIVTQSDKAHVHERLQPNSTLLMLGTRFVRHPPSERLAPGFHTEVRRLVTDFAAYARMSLVTLVANSQITCRNVANNLATYVTTPPVGILKGRFAGVPGIVVSAGPSLRRNIDLLAKAKGRAVICAVQTTLKPLLARGVVPDFVTSLDYHEVSRQYFEGAEGLEDVHLVAEPKATWHVLDHYPGPISVLDNSFARLLLGDVLAAKDALPPGATVAHLAFYLARYMGCDPIIFVGQDLAYTGHVYYSPGVEIHRTWRSEINRFNPLETKEWERTVRARSVLRKIPGHDGQELFTDELLFTYLEQFERDIARTQAKVINATEGGAAIRGASPATLAEVLEQYCRAEIPAGCFEYRATTRWRDLSRLAPAARELAARLTEIDRMESLCAQLLDLLVKLQGLTHDPPAFNRLIVRVDELRAQVHQNQRAYAIINAASQLAELRRFSADRKLTADKVEGAERAKRQLARDISFITAVRDGARNVREILETARARLDEARVRLGETQGSTA
jgi:hypothetical protein